MFGVHTLLVCYTNPIRKPCATSTSDTPSAFVPSHRYPEHRCDLTFPTPIVSFLILPLHQKPPFPFLPQTPPPAFPNPNIQPPSPSPPPAPSPPINPNPSAHSIIHPSPDRPSLNLNAHLAISATKHARRAAAYGGYSAPVRGPRAEVWSPETPAFRSG